MAGASSALGGKARDGATLGNGVAALIGINLIVYLADHVIGLPFMQALYLPMDGASWYQYFTSAFCHASWAHLSGNLVFLYLFGKLVEEQEGSLGVVASYIACGLGGNLLSELLLSDGYGLGASGAVFGLFVVSVLIKLRRDWRSLVEVLILGQFVVVQIINETKSVGADDGVGHFAHLGGAITGGLLILGVTKLLRRAPAKA